MAKFVYRMQNILNLKEKLEEQARNAYAEQRMKLSEEEEKEEELHERKRFYQEEAVKLRKEKLNILDLEENSNAIYVLDTLIAEQHERVLKEEAVLEQKRLELEEAMKERKTQDKLKEHAFDEFKADLLYQESKEIDQLTSYTYGIKQQQDK